MFRQSLRIIKYQSLHMNQFKSLITVTGGTFKISADPLAAYWPKFELEVDWKRKKNNTIKTIEEPKPKHDSISLSISEQHVKSHQYDLVIDCNKLSDLNEDGWPIYLDGENNLWYDADENYNGEKRMMPEKKTALKTVAISGLFNSGKTFFANNLCETNLPSDDNITTKGLSLKKLHSEPILIIDTAGSNSAIDISDQSLSDKITSEKILENTTYDIANFHVYVVNHLTWPEQQHLETLYQKIKLTKEYGGGKKKWPLYVVHNFRNNTLEDLRDKLLNDIKVVYKNAVFRSNSLVPNAEKGFRALIDDFIDIDKKNAKSTRNPIRYLFQKCKNWYQNNKNESDRPRFWVDANNDHTTIHLFLVNNSSPAARAYNNFVLQQIRHQISSEKEPEKELKDDQFCLNDVFDSLNNQINQHTTVMDENGEILSPFDQEPRLVVVGDKNRNTDFRLVLRDRKEQIIPKENLDLSYNALFIGTAESKWTPKYDIQYSHEMCGIWMELPGELVDTEAYIDTKDNQTQLVIRGKRQKEETYGNQFEQDSKSERYFGKFEFIINLTKEYCYLDKIERGNGVLMVQVANSNKRTF
eukprot:143806_1